MSLKHSILSADFGDNFKTFWLKVRPSLLRRSDLHCWVFSHLPTPNYLLDAWPTEKMYVLPLGCGSCIGYSRYRVPRSKESASTLQSLGKVVVTNWWVNCRDTKQLCLDTWHWFLFGVCGWLFLLASNLMGFRLLQVVAKARTKGAHMDICERSSWFRWGTLGHLSMISYSTPRTIHN